MTEASIYSHALEIWSRADLSGLQKELDDDVVQTRQNESQSLESRKVLAAETKKFKKFETDIKLQHINKIIKQYQKEIDNLTQRSKFSEQVLLKVYAKISEAPDPKPLLENSLEVLKKASNAKYLEDKIAGLEDKLAKCADYDTLKRRLETLEKTSTTTLEKKLEAKEQELASIWTEKEKNWKKREEFLLKQIETSQTTNKVLEAKINKEIDISDSDTQAGVDTKDSEIKMQKNSAQQILLVQELETSQVRIMQLEKRNEELSGLLTKATSEAERESEIRKMSLKINELESENALLVASSERERSSQLKVQEDLKMKLQNLKSEMSSYKSELETIKRKLANYKDYDKIKEELTAFKKIEFGYDDSSNDDDSDNGSSPDDTKSGHMDSTLLNMNKRLQSALSTLRAQNNSQTKENKDLKLQVLNLQKRLKVAEEANTKLERDLEQFEDIDQKINDTSSLVSGVTVQMHNRVPSGKLSPTSSIVGIPEDSELSSTSMMGNSTILPIVSKQRDRFRSRNMELEKQIRELNSDRMKLHQKIKELKKDNSNLFERVRYVSNMKGSYGDSGVNADVEAQYLDSYEESLHPLAVFREREAEKYKNSKIPAWEKLFIMFTKMVLQNRTSRMAFFFYCLGLHGLVFMMSMYVINLNGYMTPEVTQVGTSTGTGHLTSPPKGIEKIN